MKTTKFWLKGHIFQILDIFKALGIIALLLMFMNFNFKLADSVQSAKNTATSTNKIVKQQRDILNAIRQATEDNKITADQKANLLICLALIPQNDRSLDVANNCRKEVETGTFPTPVTTPLTSDNTSNKASNQPGTQTPVVSSPQSAPTGAPAQSNNVQSTPITKPSIINRVVNFLNPFN